MTGTVAGYYPIDGSTPPLSGAIVTIAGKTDTTDGAGHFQLPTIPEGNQTVTVSLAGWAAYSQSFYISSANRNLTLSLTYAGPDLRGITPVTAYTSECEQGTITSYQHGFLGGIAKLAGTLTMTQDFVVEATYQPFLLVNGHVPSSPADPVRQATMGDIIPCAGLRMGCSALLGSLPSGSGNLSGSPVRKGTWTNLGMLNVYFGVQGPARPQPAPTDYYRVFVAHWTDSPPCPEMTYQTRDVRVAYNVTLTLRFISDVNRWTHTSITFTTDAYTLPEYF